jgi:proteasome accessory factor A
MAEPTNLLKVGSVHLILQMLEAGTVLRDLTLDNPIRAIREISQDLTGRKTVRTINGRELSAIDIQTEYFEKTRDFAQRRGLTEDATNRRVIDLWERSLKAVSAGDPSAIDTEIDWAIKLSMIERYRQKHSLTMGDPKVAMLDLAYHDITRRRGLFYLLERRGLVQREAQDIAVFEAKSLPPQSTRARLRGEFIRVAQERRRDFTVDWVHLKLNDQTQRTILCKDPFKPVDERVEKLLASL